MSLIGPVRFRGKFGYLTAEGEWAIEPVFNDLGLFSEGFASFSVGGRIGFIDENGHQVIPPTFDAQARSGCWIVGFSEGLAGVDLDGQACYVDYAGTVRLRFDGSVVLWNFSKGQSLISSSIMGLRALFPDGVLGPEIKVWDIPYSQPHDWNCIRCIVSLPDRGFNVGAVNWKGDMVISSTYEELGEFHNGLAVFGIEQGGPVGLVRFDGTVVKEPTFLSISDFSEGLAPASIVQRQVGFINSDGEFTIDPDFQQASPFSDGVACVSVKNRKSGNKGFINLNGEMVIEPRFQSATSFKHGYSQVKFDEQFGIIDRTGELIWHCPLEQLECAI